MKWTKEQLTKFRANPYISEDAIYADTIMRPMAEVFCPEVLGKFDRDWNDGDNPLGPNWHSFAGELEGAIKFSHAHNETEKLEDYYSFLNWALFEKTSYLHNEAVVSPFEGIIDVSPRKWMLYLPLPILDDLIAFMEVYMVPSVAANMRTEKRRLLQYPKKHELTWKSLHKRFTKIATEKSIPYTNLLKA